MRRDYAELEADLLGVIRNSAFKVPQQGLFDGMRDGIQWVF